MNDIKSKILSFFIGIPISFGYDTLIYNLFIVETAYCYEYRFPKLSWLLDIFFDGYHYDSNLLYFIMIFSLGIITSYKLLIYFNIKLSNES